MPANAAIYPSNPLLKPIIQPIFMNQDPASLGSELKQLFPESLDSSLLSRLEAAVDGTLTELSPEELRFEQSLRSFLPAPLPEDFKNRLATVCHHVPFHVDETIVLFPKTITNTPTRRNLPSWSAAAAVALIAALTALIDPIARHQPDALAPQAAATPSPATPPANPNPYLIPASFNRGLTAVHDEGIVWKSNDQPHSLVRVTYQDHMTLKDQTGRTFEVEQPRTEYMLVPAKTD